MAKDGAQSSDDSSINKSTQLSDGGEDEEFYEEIEAPKYVDFTVPDHYRPDDRYWFCLRVGCDQKHEEEMDTEAIYKSFVLRVMTARSPNVRLHKALNRNASGKNMKCPLSAPPKSAKSRLPRLAIVSMSQKMGVVDKEKVKRLPKVISTPKTKGKQVAAKYLTTPRNKKSPPNSNTFLSVKNPKPSTVAVTKNRSVAKALVFHSPKKAINLKTSVELRTPLTKLCQGMKKLEIMSQRKHVLGNSSKPLKPPGQDSQKSLPLHSLTRHKVPNKQKSKNKISLHLHSQNDQDAKSLRSGKCMGRGNLRKPCTLKDIVQHDCIVETIMKSEDNTEEHLAASEILGHHTSADSAKEASYPVSEVDSTPNEVSKCEFDSSKQSGETSMGGDDTPRSQALDKEADTIERNTKESSENEEETNDPMNEIEPSEKPTCGSQMNESDDKENASAFDENRSIDHSSIQTGKEILRLKDTDIKVARVIDKQPKGSANIAAPGLKLKKPKPTNPKPFRLRTDERGILREANLERKNYAVAPQKEDAGSAKSQARNMQGYHCDIQRGSSRTAAIRTPKGQARKRTTTAKVLRPLTSKLESNTRQDMENDPTKTKSPSTHVLKPHRMKQTASPKTQGEGLSFTAVTPSEDSKPLAAETPNKNGSKATAGTRTPPGSKRSSRGRRPITIPKEPNFHTSHMPKSSVKNVACHHFHPCHS